MTQKIIGNADPASPAVDKPTASAKDIRIKPAENPSHEQPPSPPHDNAYSSPLLAALWRSSDKFHFLGLLDRDTNQFRNIPVDNPIDVVDHVQRFSEQNVDLYFACAEFETAENRTSANASGAYSFWLDIDCGPDKAASGKGYATIEEAEEAVRRFCSETGIPSPTHIVRSGSGLHVYWSLDEFVPHDQWRTPAQGTKPLARYLEL